MGWVGTDEVKGGGERGRIVHVVNSRLNLDGELKER